MRYSKRVLFLARMRMLEDGILPEFDSDKISKMFEGMSPERKRQVKRKFRKIWRKIRNERWRQVDNDHSFSSPSRASYRRDLVKQNFASSSIRRHEVLRFYCDQILEELKEKQTVDKSGDRL